MQSQSKAEASSVAWSWRDRAGQAERNRAREAASARVRGVVGGLIGLAVAALLYFYFRRPVPAAVVAAIAAVLTLIALVSPLGLHKKVTHVLQRFAHGVGATVTWTLMTLLYYVVFLPAGALLRAQRKLGITRHADRSLPTYWIPTRERARTPESYRRQF
ncbi:MAG TPA: hypothetical protein VF789_04460 [Thermoanaerobaculia bacterium]